MQERTFWLIAGGIIGAALTVLAIHTHILVIH